MKPSKEARKAAYMAQFETLVTRAIPSQSGRINWNYPTHYYFQSMPVTEAANRYIAHIHGAPIHAMDV
jgi:hypothetical protein